MALIGREQEMAALSRYYEEGEGVVVVYGERLLGKESLIRTFLKGRESFYLHALPLSAPAQSAIWIRELAKLGINVPKGGDFTMLFRTIASSVKSRGVLVIADFEHLFRTSGPKFAQEFFEALKEALKDRKLMVLLVSSSQSFVENRLLETLASQENLVSGILKVKPLDFSRLLSWFSDSPYSIEELLRLYGILGGYPGAWAIFGKTLPFKEALQQAFFMETSPLAHPEDIFLTPYLREMAVYNTLLELMAAPKESETHFVGRKLNDIFEHTGYPRAKILVYIKNLTYIGAVEKLRSLPVSEDLQIKAVYRFANPMLRFFYTFLFGCEQDLELLFKKCLKELPAFSRDGYRIACEEYLKACSRAGALPVVLSQVGGWVGKTGSLDLLGRSAEEVYLSAMISADPEGFSESRLNYFLLSLQKARIAPAFIYLFSLHGYSPEVIERLSGIEGIYLMDESIWQKKSS
ncbi:MAG: ATP-binding protein [Lachnospiraceae bacterium]|nr:ATP-binding protein [Lachnospiraceae bacterium]